jgi:dimethylhistidine N-methyltransferase
MNHEPHRLAARPDYLGVVDLEPSKSDFLSEAIAGLSRQPRTLPCKYFYDERGAALFQKICDLPEYYITRTETAILRLHAHEMADCIGPRCELIGLGTGAGTKTRILLEELDATAVYIPVDISKEQLRRSTALFRKIFSGLEILPVCADYLEPFDLPSPSRKALRKVVYFPGSTIGNFEPADAIIFLRRLAVLCAENGALLIGADLQKDRRVLERAYNDSASVTTQFNLNLLARANRELGADFDLKQWQHYAIYNPDEGRIEIYLISRIDQTVHFAGREFHFNSGERIVTEFSYKYAPKQFIELARAAGFNFGQMWTDAARLFGVFYFTAF